MAKTYAGMEQRLESMLMKIHERMIRWQERANERGVDVMEIRLPNGTYPMETLILAEAQTALALIMLRGEMEEAPKKEPLFDEMQHIYWSALGTSFCLAPEGVHGFLGVRGYEAGRPDCPECHEKLEQFRSM